MRRLQIFDAVARNRSVTAAVELGLTQSAVSHQVRKLSEPLGEPLLARRGRNIELTEAGHRLGASLDDAFELIEQSSEAIIGGGRAMVRLAVYSSFVEFPVGALAQAEPPLPEVDLRLVMLDDPHEVTERTGDVFVTSAPAGFGYASTRLFAERLIPCAAGEVRDWSRPMRLITTDVEPTLVGRDWEAFADLNGLEVDRLRAGAWPCRTHSLLACEMVGHEMGAALLPEHVARPHLASRRAHQLAGKALPTGQSHDIQVKHERRNERAVLRVIAWLQALARTRTDAVLD